MRQNAPRETDPFKPFKHPAKMCLNSRGGLNNLISIHLVRALAAFTLSMKQVHWMYKWGINCNLLSEWMIRSNEHDMIFFCRICYLPCFVLRMDMQSINANDWHCWAVFKFRFEPTWLQSQYDAPFIYLFIYLWYFCGIVSLSDSCQCMYTQKFKGDDYDIQNKQHRKHCGHMVYVWKTKSEEGHKSVIK